MWNILNMINTSNMIKASDLKVGDKILSNTGIEYNVIANHIGDVLFILANNGTGDHLSNGLHLFYEICQQEKLFCFMM